MSRPAVSEGTVLNYRLQTVFKPFCTCCCCMAGGPALIELMQWLCSSFIAVLLPVHKQVRTPGTLACRRKVSCAKETRHILP